MTATLSTAFQNHLKQSSQRRCKMLRLDLADGTVLGFTDHDNVLDFDLGDAAGTVSYRPDQGMLISNVQTGLGLDAGNFEVTFPIAESPRPFTREAVAGGRFRRCEARLFEVVWSNLSAGARKFMYGNAGEWRIEGDKAISEIRDQRDRLNQTTGRILQNQCDADYADQIQCFATPTDVSATVTAVTSPTQITVSFAGSYADGFFDRGQATFTSGTNDGIRPIPVWSWTAAGVVKFYWPPVEPPEIGDTLTIRDGCARTRAACMAHGQILNYRGFPEVPGSQALKPAIPPKSSGGGGKGGK